MTNKKKSGAQRARDKASKSATAAADSTFDQAAVQNGHEPMQPIHPRPSSSSSSSSSSDSESEAQSPEQQAEKLKDQGTAAYKAKAYSKAVDLYSAAIEACDSHTPAIFNRAAAFMALKAFPKALADCQTVLSLQRQQGADTAKTLARLGKCQLSIGQVEQAAQTLSQARSMPTLESTQLNGVLADLAKIDRINNHINSINRAKAEEGWSMVSFGLEALAKEVEVEPLQWKIWRLEALVMRNKSDEATYLATNIVRQDPSNPEALFYRGLIFYKQGNWDQARIHFERSLARDPDFKPLIPALKKIRAFDNKREAGKQAMAKKDYAAAATCYSEALEIDPKHEQMRVLLLSNRALAYNGLKQYQDAIADCESVLAIDSTHWKALRSRARAELKLEKYEDAVTSFKEALEAVDDSSKDEQSIKSELQGAERELKRSKQKDYYKELGLNRHDDPSDSDIKRAYKKMSLKHHPDKTADGSDDKFKQIGEAYEILSDPVKKRRFDNGEELDGQPDMSDMFGGGGGGHPFGGGGFGGGGFGGFGGGGMDGMGGINLEDLLNGGGRGRRPF